MRPHDLVAFFGHPGMEAAVGLVQRALRSTGRKGRRQAAAFLDDQEHIRRSTGRPSVTIDTAESHP
ncbi:MAG: hypothetical protein R2754_16035 [Microthrixaceae bacterium]